MQIKREYKGQMKVYKLDFNYYEDNNYYKISALNENNEEVGFLTFKLIEKPCQIWLYKIETKEECQDQGYGTAMIDALEFFACKRGITSIEGKYYPSNKKAKPFYEKLGYIIDVDDYDQFVSKFIYIKPTYENLLPRVKDFEIKTFAKEEEILQSR